MCDCKSKIEQEAREQGLKDASIAHYITYKRNCKTSKPVIRTYSMLYYNGVITFGRGKGNVKRMGKEVLHEYCPWCGEKQGEEEC